LFLSSQTWIISHNQNIKFNLSSFVFYSENTSEGGVKGLNRLWWESNPQDYNYHVFVYNLSSLRLNAIQNCQYFFLSKPHPTVLTIEEPHKKENYCPG
jgi:hypothetical protein